MRQAWRDRLRLGITLIAHDPSAAHEDMVLILRHVILSADLPNSIIKIIEFFADGGSNAVLGQDFGRVLSRYFVL